MTATAPPSARRLRRCRHLLVELDSQPRIALSNILAGGAGRITTPRWLARAAHLDAPVPVSLAQLAVLQAVPTEGEATAADTADAADVDYLLAHGLLFDLTAAATSAAARDEAVGRLPWWGPAAVAHAHGRWHDNDVAARWARLGKTSSGELVQRYGPAPLPFGATGEHRGQPLPEVPAGAFDSLLEARATCRQFDPTARLGLEALSHLLYRVAAVQGTQTLSEGAVALKKYAPAGGGLHATDVALLVRRVDGLSPGLYRYDPFDHALCLHQALDAADGEALAYRMLGGQDWFVAAPVLLVLISRFDRLFWKYRQHSKAWKVAQLDAGHLSQLAYLSAAEQGLGAFVTAAINDAVIEQAFDLDPAREGVAALFGVGARGGPLVARELDAWQASPARRRWLLQQQANAKPDAASSS